MSVIGCISITAKVVDVYSHYFAL